MQKKAGTAPTEGVIAGQRRKEAMARLFPQPVANFKAPALELKGRNMKEAAQDIPDGHFVVGGRVYKLSAAGGEDKKRGGDSASSEAMRMFLERKQPDEVPPWAEQGSCTVLDMPGGSNTSGAKQQQQRRDSLQERGAQSRAQQLGPFGSGRGSEAGAGGRPWSPIEPAATKVIPRAQSRDTGRVSRQRVERSGWMWRPLSQGGPIVAAFGKSAPRSQPPHSHRGHLSVGRFLKSHLRPLLLTNAGDHHAECRRGRKNRGRCPSNGNCI